MMVKSEGFRDDVSGFIQKCRSDCQLLFFSATYPEDCEAYCRSLAPQAFLVKVPKNNLMIKHIFQVRMTVPVGGKVQMLKDAYEILGVESSIVFLDTGTCCVMYRIHVYSCCFSYLSLVVCK